jgi:hypothetical protein
MRIPFHDAPLVAAETGRTISAQVKQTLKMRIRERWNIAQDYNGEPPSRIFI